MKFRDNLLCLRQQRNMTQEQLAMLLGVSRQSVAKWEAGQSTPEVDKLVKMADLFGCALDELVSGDLSQRSVHGMTDVENYNRKRADEQWERDNPQVGRACGIIMLAATALGLLLLFGGMAASDAGNSGLATVCAYFWVAWPIGGIACAITSLAMKATAGK